MTKLELVDGTETLVVLVVTGIDCIRCEGSVEYNVHFPVLCSLYSSKLGGRSLLVPDRAWASEPGGEI